MEYKPSSSVPNVTISSCSKQGLREYNEDRIDVQKMKDGRIAMIVYDGHGGSACSSFCVNRTMRLLLDYDGWDVYKIMMQVSDEWDRMCMKKLRIRSLPQNAEERKKIFQGPHMKEYYAEEWHSGSTGVVLILDVINQRGKYGSVGDSRLLWKDFGKHQSRLRSTKDHNPRLDDLGHIPAEITQDAGDVKRIASNLAVGRSYGDHDEDLMNTVLHNPIVTEFVWKNKGPIKCIIATDGIFDVLSNSRVMKLSDASTIVDEALRKGSGDNCTAGVIQMEYQYDSTS
jgi:serine/threonine protein phosphatase PrpC